MHGIVLASVLDALLADECVDSLSKVVHLCWCTLRQNN